MTRGVCFLTPLLGICLSVFAAAPESLATAPPDRAAVLKAARAVIKAARFCALVTIGPDGHPQARAVDAFDPEEDMTVWIATNPVTRKVADIRKDPRVTLFYMDKEGLGYVTIIGKAELVDDKAQKAKHWKEEWNALYVDKNSGDDYLLVRVKPIRLEIVSFAHKMENDPKSWRPVSIEFP